MYPVMSCKGGQRSLASRTGPNKMKGRSPRWPLNAVLDVNRGPNLHPEALSSPRPHRQTLCSLILLL